MRSGSRLVSLGAPAAIAACVVFAWTAANAQPGDVTVVRHREFDGEGAISIEVVAIERSIRETKAGLARDLARLVERRERGPRDDGHHAGLKACFSERTRQVRFAFALPEAMRGRVVYVVSVAKSVKVPEILDATLPLDAVVLVAEAEMLSDVAALSTRIGRPVSLASPEVLRALGVSCRDAKVTIRADGSSAQIEEVAR